MKLQILIPQYQETDEIIKPLLDSIALQQNVDMNEIGAIIANDGSDVFLSESFLQSYPFKIEYYKNSHQGVSATRNYCLDKAIAEYVMFCDADDMFYNMCGLYIIFRDMEFSPFDGILSVFTEETRDSTTGYPVYINREMDSTFVHGKVYRRQYLIDNNIRFNPNLTIHEDSYFNCLAQKCATELRFCPTPFYLWRWRDESVCRHDPKYSLNTYNNMIESNDALVEEFIRRERIQDAQYYVTFMVYDAYFTMNKDEWINQENKQYRNMTELRFKEYYRKYKKYFDEIDHTIKAQIIMNIKNRFYTEGLLMESVTFDDWIKHIDKL